MWLFLIAILVFIISCELNNCDAGRIKDCYNINVWNEELPFQTHSPPNSAGICNSEVDYITYNTGPVRKAEDRVQLVVGLAIFSVKPTSSEHLAFCTDNQKLYNLTLAVGLDYNATKTENDLLMAEINKLTSTEQGGFEFSDENDEFTVAKGLQFVQLLYANGKKFINTIEVPEAGTYWYSVYFNYPAGEKDKCYVKFSMYSCWVTVIWWKILIVVLVILAVITCICCIAVGVPLILCCICMKKLKQCCCPTQPKFQQPQYHTGVVRRI